jgi:DNA-binding transcriptional MerR regulator
VPEWLLTVLDVYVNVNQSAGVPAPCEHPVTERPFAPDRVPSAPPVPATGTAEPTFGIGDLAREFGVTTRAIRFYEDCGLLAPLREGSMRVYRPRDRVRLKLILRGKRLGFSLAEVREMLDMYDAPQGAAGQLHHFIGKIRSRRADLLRQREEIDHVLAELDILEARCDALLAAADEPARRRRA